MPAAAGRDANVALPIVLPDYARYPVTSRASSHRRRPPATCPPDATQYLPCTPRGHAHGYSSRPAAADDPSKQTQQASSSQLIRRGGPSIFTRNWPTSLKPRAQNAVELESMNSENSSTIYDKPGGAFRGSCSLWQNRFIFCVKRLVVFRVWCGCTEGLYDKNTTVHKHAPTRPSCVKNGTACRRNRLCINPRATSCPLLCNACIHCMK